MDADLLAEPGILWTRTQAGCQRRANSTHLCHGAAYQGQRLHRRCDRHHRRLRSRVPAARAAGPRAANRAGRCGLIAGGAPLASAVGLAPTSARRLNDYIADAIAASAASAASASVRLPRERPGRRRCFKLRSVLALPPGRRRGRAGARCWVRVNHIAVNCLIPLDLTHPPNQPPRHILRLRLVSRLNSMLGGACSNSSATILSMSSRRGRFTATS